MANQLDDNRPIYIQIKEMIEDSILNGTFAENERIPSTNELAKYYTINPATARQGMNELVQEQIIEKKRGVGMFVTEEARTIIMKKRQQAFYEAYILPLKLEAKKIHIADEEIIKMIRKGGV